MSDKDNLEVILGKLDGKTFNAKLEYVEVLPPIVDLRVVSYPDGYIKLQTARQVKHQDDDGSYVTEWSDVPVINVDENGQEVTTSNG
ncbi:hypothetical protein MHM93_14405 [Pseudoalteromonas sp. MM17-2]|uniref:hypothetical protein n=1 Tax=Pseudoalteromonas sp. MM17-2 TaxID=2917753 RepID=UPI001EF4A980|nr:hypothetical protein [Pseudoalteromonas sp. MM17-2]MCG7545369.1 hypothetical protein [Pseudoalteromonas sp. MM17-2]